MNYFKKVETIIIACIILVLGVAYGYLSNKHESQSNQTQDSQTQLTQDENNVRAEYVFYTGQDGRTALDILKTLHSVQTDSFGGLGEFVTSIDGVDAGTTHFWALYVNGQMAQAGADAYVTKSTDKIEWKLEAIK